MNSLWFWHQWIARRKCRDPYFKLLSFPGSNTNISACRQCLNTRAHFALTCCELVRDTVVQYPTQRRTRDLDRISVFFHGYTDTDRHKDTHTELVICFGVLWEERLCCIEDLNFNMNTILVSIYYGRGIMLSSLNTSCCSVLTMDLSNMALHVKWWMASFPFSNWKTVTTTGNSPQINGK